MRITASELPLWKQARAASKRVPRIVFRPSQLSKMKGREQVAAVCFRVRRCGIEFLLVQTRGGRWTFPKGGTEPGLTHAQAAALEAFEEAGVHGRMEDAAFASYTRGDGPPVRKTRTPAVQAHLCEVLRQERPKESGRKPTWFSAEKAKRRLEKDRAEREASELGRVVDLAVEHILRARSSARLRASTKEFRDTATRDALQKVQFEAPSVLAIPKAAFFRYRRRQISETGVPLSVEVALADYVANESQVISQGIVARDAPSLKRTKQLALVAPRSKTPY